MRCPCHFNDDKRLEAAFSVTLLGFPLDFNLCSLTHTNAKSQIKRDFCWLAVSLAPCHTDSSLQSTFELFPKETRSFAVSSQSSCLPLPFSHRVHEDNNSPSSQTLQTSIEGHLLSFKTVNRRKKM